MNHIRKAVEARLQVVAAKVSVHNYRKGDVVEFLLPNNTPLLKEFPQLKGKVQKGTVEKAASSKEYVWGDGDDGLLFVTPTSFRYPYGFLALKADWIQGDKSKLAKSMKRVDPNRDTLHEFTPSKKATVQGGEMNHIEQAVIKRLEMAAPKSQTVIEISVNEGSDAATMIPRLLYQLQKMGDFGCSRNIKIEDWAAEGDADTEKFDLRNSFGFDGDGADHITSLKVDGKSYKPEKRT